MLNVAILNGGRGATTLIPALLRQKRVHLTSIVNAYDDGKSTGTIRRLFGMLGPSDIRKVQELMLSPSMPDHDSVLALFQYRFPEQVTRDQALLSLRTFVDGRSSRLADVGFSTPSITSSLRTFLSTFLRALEVVEVRDRATFEFSDWSLMNCVYAGAFLQFERNLEDAVLFFDKLFQLQGTVLPTSIEDKKLVAIRENGEMLCSEAEIVELRSNSRIRKIYLHDQYPDRHALAALTPDQRESYFELNNSFVRITDRVRHALSDADIIVYAPGTQHSSLYPSYMSRQLAATITQNTKATKVFVPNIGADYETPMYTASDYVSGAVKYLSLGFGAPLQPTDLFTHILVNQPRAAGDNYVQYSASDMTKFNCPLVINDFESDGAVGRHDGHKLVETIFSLHEARVLPPRVEEHGA